MATTASQPVSKTLALVQQSIALRAKYKVSDVLTRVSPIHIGFHPANRNGEPPSAERCVTLLNDILVSGFDPSEADCNGVLVQELPGQTSIHAFNQQSCEGQDQLAHSVEGQMIAYGSLSHSHLNQVFKNILAKLPLGIEKITLNGKCEIGLLADHDPVFAKYCREGLLWDVLSHAIMTEEPEGLNIIQAACNSRNALVMIPHEMEAIASVSRLCKSSAAVAATLCFQTVKDAISLTLPMTVADPDFIHLFRFVVDLGGDSGPFIADLRDFTARFLNPQAPDVSNEVCTFGLFN